MVAKLLTIRARATRSRRDLCDRGVVLALTALLLVPLVAATGFAVDVGAWYARAERMQRAADAAALAAVVWVDDEQNPNLYRTVAFDTARKNGFEHNPPDMTVSVDKVGQAQVRVTITEDADQYFSQIVLDDQDLARSGTAEYVLPVPMGSPRNFLGTGRMGYSASSSSVYAPEGLTLSINGYCTDKNQGDQKASRFEDTESCSGSNRLNDEYTVPNYEYYIEVPPGRSYDTDVLLFDPAYVPDDRTSKGLPSGQRFAADFNPGGNQSGQDDTMDTTFELFRADNTPLDDSDNPSMATTGSCSSSGPSGADGAHTFQGDPGGNYLETNASFFPTGGGAAFWNSTGWWNLCRIPSSAPAGRYILRVNNEVPNPRTRGSNNFAIVANRVGNTSLCDSRFDTACPKVYAKDYLSIRGNQYSGGGSYIQAQFFLAEVGGEHAGKRLEIDLWDPAEGGYAIRLLAPTGSNSWGFVNFDWESSDGNSGNNTSFVPVYNYNFNGDLLSLSLDLAADYTPPTDNAWWKIEYTYVGDTVTDRTTWSVNITGDPVHLVD